MDDKNTSQNNSLKNKVLGKIQAGEIHMKSKSYFVFRIILIVSVVVLVLIVSAFLVSYILFSLKTSGRLFLLDFGMRGVVGFFTGFPWLLLLTDVVLLIILDYMLKNFRFGYHNPVIYLFLGTFILALVFGYVIELTPLHKTLLLKTEERSLPIMSGFYSGLKKSRSREGVFSGTVVIMNSEEFVLKHDDYDEDEDDKIIKVVAPRGFKLDSKLKSGDRVFVAGEIKDDEIEAYGIRKLEDDD